MSRGVTGRGLARDRLEAFINALAIREIHARQLRALADGESPPDTILGLLSPPNSETTSPEYVTNFHNSGDVVPCFRRAAHGRMQNVVIRVEFHPDCLPRSIWWAV